MKKFIVIFRKPDCRTEKHSPEFSKPASGALGRLAW